MNKICTSIKQSKKLIELGININTADMYWWYSGKRYYIEAMDDGDFNEKEGHIRAWSLAALLDVIPKHTDLCKSSSNENKDIIVYWCYNFPNNLTTVCYDNPIDACCEMILKLHELNLL